MATNGGLSKRVSGTVPETACVIPAHSHNDPVLRPGIASVCVPGSAGGGGERPAFFTRSRLLNRCGQPLPHGTNLRARMFCLVVVALTGCASGPSGNGTQAPYWERDVVGPAPVAPIPLAVPLARELVFVPPAPSVPTNQPAETWISLSRWCKANGLAAPFLVGQAPAIAYALSTPGGGLVLHPGSQVAYWDGLDVRVGVAPQMMSGQPD